MEKVSYVANAKMFGYGERVLESRYHLLSVLPCVGVNEASSSSSPLFGGARAIALARERSVEKMDDVDLLKVVWVDRWPGNKGAEMESYECNIGSECALVDCAGDLGREEARDIEDPWVFGKFADFCFRLWLSTVGFEKDIVKLMKRMKEKRECKGKGICEKKSSQKLSLFNCELKPFIGRPRTKNQKGIEGDPIHVHEDTSLIMEHSQGK